MMESLNRDSKNYRQIKASVDYDYFRRKIVLSTALAVLLVPILCLNLRQSIFARVAILLYFCMTLLIDIIRQRNLFRQIDHYFFFEAVLDQPHTIGSSRFPRVYFTVNVTDPQGRQFQSNTDSIFSPRHEPSMDAYINKRVLAAYNPKTSRLVIVKKFP